LPRRNVAADERSKHMNNQSKPQTIKLGSARRVTKTIFKIGVPEVDNEILARE